MDAQLIFFFHSTPFGWQPQTLGLCCVYVRFGKLLSPRVESYCSSSPCYLGFRAVESNLVDRLLAALRKCKADPLDLYAALSYQEPLSPTWGCASPEWKIFHKTWVEGEGSGPMKTFTTKFSKEDPSEALLQTFLQSFLRARFSPQTLVQHSLRALYLALDGEAVKLNPFCAAAKSANVPQELVLQLPLPPSGCPLFNRFALSARSDATLDLRTCAPSSMEPTFLTFYPQKRNPILDAIDFLTRFPFNKNFG